MANGHSGDNAGPGRGRLSHRHHVLLVPLVRPLRDRHLRPALNTRRYRDTEIHCLLDNRSTRSGVYTTCGTTVLTPMKLSSLVNCSNIDCITSLLDDTKIHNTAISVPIDTATDSKMWYYSSDPYDIIIFGQL